MRICYTPKRFGAASQSVIDQANAICAQYQAQGLTLTLRQLYYQFVARDYLANSQQNYKRLGSIVVDARMAGEMDWDYLIDRTRNRVSPSTWNSPSSIIRAVASQYATDLWADQHHRIVVFIEKDAAIGVIERVCSQNQIPYFSCRGYVSVSEIWAAAQTVKSDIEAGNRVTILHIGDHDPSGLDMTRDITDRLKEILKVDWCNDHWEADGEEYEYVEDHMRGVIREAGGEIEDWDPPFEVLRIALNYDQVLQYSPPPNPAKASDIRYMKYVRETGLTDSWELDALEPNVLVGLIQREVDARRNDDVWATSMAAQNKEKAILRSISDRWSEAVQMFGGAA